MSTTVKVPTKVLLYGSSESLDVKRGTWPIELGSTTRAFFARSSTECGENISGGETDRGRESVYRRVKSIRAKEAWDVNSANHWVCDPQKICTRLGDENRASSKLQVEFSVDVKLGDPEKHRVLPTARSGLHTVPVTGTAVVSTGDGQARTVTRRPSFRQFKLTKYASQRAWTAYLTVYGAFFSGLVDPSTAVFEGNGPQKCRQRAHGTGRYARRRTP
ncbi:hypothetical protein K438DRAFT_1928200 [Mycena galopus ATCC 62051]|nr:hypothetical protein K438DRAFT_1928200 [Mycena galopus ATCC 62051]